MTLLHVAIGYKDVELPATKIQEVFGAAGWARYAPNCWILKSAETPKVWAERLRKVCNPNDSIFVAKIETPQYSGYLQKQIWEWIDKHK